MPPTLISFQHDDSLFVSKLIAFDDEAWEYLISEIVTPLAKSNKLGIASIFRRHSMPLESIISEIFLNLTNNDCAVLRNFRYECSFRTYMYLRVYAAAQAVIRKKTGNIPLVLSDLTEGTALIECDDASSSSTTDEHVNQANQLLERLWKENPAYALVLLMRHDLKLPSRDVGLLMGKTQANIDQLLHRAQKRMSDYRRTSDEQTSR